MSCSGVSMSAGRMKCQNGRGLRAFLWRRRSSSDATRLCFGLLLSPKWRLPGPKRSLVTPRPWSPRCRARPLGGAVAFEQLGGRRFPIHADELGFAVEEVEVAGRAAHEEEDDVLGLGGKRRGLGAWGLMTGAAARASPSPQSFMNQRRENERWVSARVDSGNMGQ
jgi:hypothetical protein